MITLPTLKELYEGIKTDIETELGVNIPTYGKVFLNAFAAVQAGKLWLNYVLLGKVQKNIFADTADPESLGGTLERFGRVKIGRDPYGAVSGQYIVSVTGSIGAIIPESTTLKSNDDSFNPSILYIVDTSFTLTATTDYVTVRCLMAGGGGKLLVGDQLTFTAPIALVNKGAIVETETITPLSAETTEDYRDVVLNSFRLEPQGGAPVDFRLWASDASGVRETYPYRSLTQLAEVDIYVEANLSDSTDGKGTPSTPILNDVSSLIELNPDTTLDINLRGRRPMGVFVVNSLPIELKQVDIIVVGGIVFTTEQRTVVNQAIIDYLYSVRPYVVGASSDARNDTISVNKLSFVISVTYPNVVFNYVTFEVSGTPVSAYQFIRGEIPTLNTVTYA